MIGRIQRRLADRTDRTVVLIHQMDLGSETELRIQVKNHWFDDDYLANVVDNQKSWFTRIDVLDVISHQFFIPLNSFWL